MREAQTLTYSDAFLVLCTCLAFATICVPLMRKVAPPKHPRPMRIDASVTADAVTAASGAPPPILHSARTKCCCRGGSCRPSCGWPGPRAGHAGPGLDRADRDLVGLASRHDALAGMALVFPPVMLMQMLSAGAIGGGISSLIARAIGGGRRDEADALVLHAVVINIALGLAFMAVMLSSAGRSTACSAAAAASWRRRCSIPTSSSPAASCCG